MPFNIDLVEAVDHDLSDGWILEKPLKGSVTHHLVRDLADEATAFLGRKRHLLLVDYPGQLVHSCGPEFFLGGRRVAEPGSEPFE
jgi:hypothetical protein